MPGVRERGGGTRGGAEGGRRGRAEVCNGARSCLCCGAAGQERGQDSGGGRAETRRESRLYSGGRRPQRGEAEPEAREEEETSGIRSRNVRLRRGGGVGDSTGIPSSWNLDARVGVAASVG